MPMRGHSDRETPGPRRPMRAWRGEGVRKGHGRGDALPLWAVWKARGLAGGRRVLGQDRAWACSRLWALLTGGPLISQQIAYSASPRRAGSRQPGWGGGKTGDCPQVPGQGGCSAAPTAPMGGAGFQRPLGGPLARDSPDRPQSGRGGWGTRLLCLLLQGLGLGWVPGMGQDSPALEGRGQLCSFAQTRGR